MKEIQMDETQICVNRIKKKHRPLGGALSSGFAA